jgi:glyoxylate/hydroxypyruvate reductase
MNRASPSRVHLHIENTGNLGPVFEVTQKRLDQALAKHPAVAERLKVTLGKDADIYDQAIETADVLFGWSFDRGVLRDRARRLKWVHVHGAGVNHLMPLDWLPQGAVLTNSRGVHGHRATEYAIMAILALNNRLPEMVTNQAKGVWQQLYNTSVQGKTLLVIGVGSVGGRTASLAKHLGMNVIGIRRTGESHPSVDEMCVPEALDTVLPRADFVLVTAPHTEKTHHLLGRKQLDLLKTGAGIVNYSRANLVDYEALREKLNAGQLSAVLDVFDPEPLPAASPLWTTPNLIITPHSSSDDAEAYTPTTLDLVMTNMARFLSGEELLNRVRPELGY